VPCGVVHKHPLHCGYFSSHLKYLTSGGLRTADVYIATQNNFDNRPLHLPAEKLKLCVFFKCMVTFPTRCIHIIVYLLVMAEWKVLAPDVSAGSLEQQQLHIIVNVIHPP